MASCSRCGTRAAVTLLKGPISRRFCFLAPSGGLRVVGSNPAAPTIGGAPIRRAQRRPDLPPTPSSRGDALRAAGGSDDAKRQRDRVGLRRRSCGAHA